MIRSFIILFLLGISTIAYSQKLFFRIDWNAAQLMKWKMNEPVKVDTNYYTGYRYYINEIQSYSKIIPEIPGVSLEFRAKNNFYIHSGLNYTQSQFWDNPRTQDLDSTKNSVVFKFHRYSYFLQSGYYFRDSRLFRPFLSAGISLTLLRATIGYESDYKAYINYFNTTPLFMSAMIKGGVRHGGMTFGLSYSLSLTPTSHDNKMGRFSNLTLFSFSWDIIRTSYLKKSQYKTKFETDDLKIKRAQILKQSEKSWSLGMPYYRFVNGNYLNAYSEGSVNYRIEPSSRPVSSWVPYINFNTINALNAKRTFYAQTNLGYSNVRLNYKDAKTQTSPGGYYLTPGNTIYTTEKSDLKIVYHSFWAGIGNGFKIKTTRRSFIYLDYDVRINYFKRIDDTQLYIPPVKKMFLSGSIEGGLKFNHLGIALSLERNISKLDKFQFYDHMFNLSLKLIYDVSSR